MSGVAAVSRKGGHHGKRDILIKNGFESVDKAKSDFELLALKFYKDAKNPSFIKVSAEECRK